jgi:hypothetical protein
VQELESGWLQRGRRKVLTEKSSLVRKAGGIFIIIALAATISCMPGLKPDTDFEVVSLSAAPAEVTIGEVAQVTAKIVNVGEVQDTYEAVLAIDDVEFERKDISIPAEGISTVTFSVAKNDAGTYNLSISDCTASLIVSDPLQQIRSSWESLEPLASLGLEFWKLVENRNLLATGQITSSKYEQQKTDGLAKFDQVLEETGNTELKQKGAAFKEAVTQDPPPPNYSMLGAEFLTTYIDCLESTVDELRSNLETKRKGILYQDLQVTWQSIEPFAQLELLIAENFRDSYLLQSEEITQNDLYVRTNNVGERIDAVLKNYGNEDFAEKFTTAWFKPWGAEKIMLWSNFIDLYQSLYFEPIEVFSQKLGR